MTTRTAACQCGGLTATCDGEPDVVSLCSCLDCQRRTGSAFGLVAVYPREAVTVNGPSRKYGRVAESGNPSTMHFCPTCGSTVFWEAESRPGILCVAMGAFGDPTFPMPVRTVYDETRHPWIGFEAATRL
jgi:hypothetical protein